MNLKILRDTQLPDEFGERNDRLVVEYNQDQAIFVRDMWEEGTGWRPLAVITVSKEELKSALGALEQSDECDLEPAGKNRE